MQKDHSRNAISQDTSFFNNNFHVDRKMTVSLMYKKLQKRFQSTQHPINSILLCSNVSTFEPKISTNQLSNEQLNHQNSIKTQYNLFLQSSSKPAEHYRNDKNISSKRKSYSINGHIKSESIVNETKYQKFNNFLMKTYKNNSKKRISFQGEEQISNSELKIKTAFKFNFDSKKQKPIDKIIDNSSTLLQNYNNSLTISSFNGDGQQKRYSSIIKGGGFISLIKQKLDSNRQELESKQYLKTVKYQKTKNNTHDQKSISQNTIKLQSMINCLDIILNSFNCYITQSKERSEQSIKKYTYYIGNGNNSELIRSIFKKRSWWSQSDKIQKSHLVWSQIKNKKVIQKLERVKQNVKTISFQQDQSKMHFSNLFKISQKMPIFKTKNVSQLNLKQQNYNFLFHQSQQKCLHRPLSEKEIKSKLTKIQSPQLIHNHYQHNYMLGNKNALYLNLTQYYTFQSKQINEIIPLTFYLQSGNQTSLKRFKEQFDKNQQNKYIWILKPGQNTNRGQRISLTQKYQQIENKLEKQQKLIVQQYIKDLFLYNGRKLDIRTYLLAITINGRLKFYFYQEGYIRTASQLFNTLNINDKYVHLTNDAIQKNSQKYGKHQQGNKLSYMEFQRYLTTKCKRQNYSVFQLHEKMRKIALQAVKATYFRLDISKKAYSFELFGLDFLINSSFKPYLIEINTNPCLQLSSQSLERLIPRMIQNIFRIGIDPLFRPNSNQSSKHEYLYNEKSIEKNRFRLIFDEKYDKNPIWQQVCRKTKIFDVFEAEDKELTVQSQIY